MEALHRRRPRLRRDKRGMAALETAAVAPFLLLIIVACVDFGRALSQRIELTNAARAGAQYAVTAPQFAIIPGQADPVTQAVKNALPTHLQAATVTTTCYCGKLQGETDLPSPQPCNEVCNAPDARMMTIRAELPFTPVNFAITPALATKFGFNTVSGHVTTRHQ